jgi:hypothetical protein
MRVFDGYTRTTEDQSVRDRLQVKGGADEQPAGVLIKDVAESLCIHPFMLSRWRKEVRDGELVGRPAPIRLHSALRYLPPVAFERQQGRQPCVN